MIGAIKIKYTGAVPGVTLKRRDLNNEVKKPAWGDGGVYWHRKILPKKFTKAGAREYKYAKRKGEGLDKRSKAYRQSYTGRKERRFGHTLPLVFTGETRRNSRMRRVKPTSKGVRVTLPGTQKLNRKNPRSQTNPPLELRAFSRRDIEAVTEQVDRGMDKRLKGYRKKKTKVVK